jgi:hypothetical protein
MAPDSATRTDAGSGEVMAAVSEGRLVLADISRDDAWLSVPLSRAAVLEEHR